MRVLIDECLPRKLKYLLPGHDVITVPEAGWQGMKNGNLLREAQHSFDVLLTIDSGMAFQQNLSGLQIAVIALSAPDNRLITLRPLVASILHALVGIEDGQHITISA